MTLTREVSFIYFFNVKKALASLQATANKVLQCCSINQRTKTLFSISESFETTKPRKKRAATPTFRALFHRSLLMEADSGSQSSEFPKHEGEYAVTNLQLKKGKIPKLTSDRIYNRTMLSRLNFWKGYTIKTVGEWSALGNEGRKFSLFSPPIIKKYRKKYDFIHVGFVQISIKAVAKLGTNASVRVILRDERLADVKQSILVAFETSVSLDSPMHFNLYPDVLYYLREIYASEYLHLTIQPQGCEMKDFTKHLNMRFRMCYKVFKTSLEAQPLIKGPRLEIDTQKSHILVPVVNGNHVVLQSKKD